TFTGRFSPRVPGTLRRRIEWPTVKVRRGDTLAPCAPPSMSTRVKTEIKGINRQRTLVNLSIVSSIGAGFSFGLVRENKRHNVSRLVGFQPLTQDWGRKPIMIGENFFRGKQDGQATRHRLDGPDTNDLNDPPGSNLSDTIFTKSIKKPLQ